MAEGNSHMYRRKLLGMIGGATAATVIGPPTTQTAYAESVQSTNAECGIPDTSASFTEEGYERTYTRDDYDEFSSGGFDFSLQGLHNLTYFGSNFGPHNRYGTDVWTHYFSIAGYLTSHMKDNSDWELWSQIEEHEFIIDNLDTSVAEIAAYTDHVGGYPKVVPDPDPPKHRNFLYTAAKQFAESNPIVGMFSNAVELVDSLFQGPSSLDESYSYSASWDYSESVCEAAHGMAFDL